MFENRLHNCCETVIAALAARIEQLEDELRWKQQRLENLEKQNAALKEGLNRQAEVFTACIADEDPFGGDEDE